MKNILILPNPVKPLALELTGRVLQSILRFGYQPVLEMKIARQLDLKLYGKEKNELWEDLDLVMVLGGDGSILSAARRIYPREIPVLGVNLGHLGFMTRVECNKLEEAMGELYQGNFQYEDRTMLEAKIVRGQSLLQKMTALNDMVVASNAATRMIRLETWIDEEYFMTYPADGLIVATATGSTAYSLSAGGPILDPRLQAILVTPICAHSLCARTLVLNETVKIKLILNSAQADVLLTADGQKSDPLQTGDEIDIEKASHATKLLRFNNQGLFEVLRSRLEQGRI